MHTQASGIERVEGWVLQFAAPGARVTVGKHGVDVERDEAVLGSIVLKLKTKFAASPRVLVPGCGLGSSGVRLASVGKLEELDVLDVDEGVDASHRNGRRRGRAAVDAIHAELHALCHSSVREDLLIRPAQLHLAGNDVGRLGVAPPRICISPAQTKKTRGDIRCGQGWLRRTGGGAREAARRLNRYPRGVKSRAYLGGARTGWLPLYSSGFPEQAPLLFRKNKNKGRTGKARRYQAVVGGLRRERREAERDSAFLFRKN